LQPLEFLSNLKPHVVIFESHWLQVILPINKNWFDIVLKGIFLR
jgi:hypothetical protein